MLAGRSIALPVWGWPDRGRESPRRSAEPTLIELDGEPDDPEVTRCEEPDDDPPEPVLDPPRDEADPDLPLEDEDGVREPAGVCTRGGSTTRAGSGALELDDSPDDPEDPEPEDPDPAGGVRGIAWAYAAAGTVSATARATTTSERGFLSMTMHSFNVRYPTGRLLLQTLQQYCHQTGRLDLTKNTPDNMKTCPQSRPPLPSGADGLTMPVPALLSRT